MRTEESRKEYKHSSGRSLEALQIRAHGFSSSPFQITSNLHRFAGGAGAIQHRWLSASMIGCADSRRIATLISWVSPLTIGTAGIDDGAIEAARIHVLGAASAVTTTANCNQRDYDLRGL